MTHISSEYMYFQLYKKSYMIVSYNGLWYWTINFSKQLDPFKNFDKTIRRRNGLISCNEFPENISHILFTHEHVK